MVQIKGLARKPGPIQAPTPSPPPLVSRRQPKQEKRDTSPIPQSVVSRAQAKPQLRSSPQYRPISFPGKNAPVTRSQLQKPSPATIEPVDPLRLLRTKMVHDNSPPPRPRDKVVLRKLPLKKVKRRKSPERDSVCIVIFCNYLECTTNFFYSPNQWSSIAKEPVRDRK